MSFGLILDSHKDESLNFVLMYSYWFRKKKNSDKLDIIHIGSYENYFDSKIILNELHKFGLVNITHLPVYDINLNKVKRFYYLLLFVIKYFKLLFFSKLLFVPYDQKRWFYFLLKFRLQKTFALPHTLGLEIYNDNIFKEKKKFKKSIPIIAKIKGCEEYFKYLGYRKIIYGGIFFHQSRNDKFFTNLIYSKKSKIDKIHIFTLHKNSNQYSILNWLKTHIVLFKVLKEKKIKSISIGLHPSQPKSDLKLLYKISRRFSVKLIPIYKNALLSFNKNTKYINILTSAGQISYILGAQTCNFLLKSMRKSVKKFGNDPYPYKKIGVLEIDNLIDLTSWLRNNKIKSKKDFKLKNLIELKCLQNIEIIKNI